MNNFLYFPRCKIVKGDAIPNPTATADGVFTFVIKSLLKTPKHYPKHFMLEGNPSFFFKLSTPSRIIWQIMHEKQFTTIFGIDSTLQDVKKLIGTEVCVLALLNTDKNIILNCLGIGLPDSNPILFQDGFNKEEMENYSKVAILNYKLTTKSDINIIKKQKI
jgi:hypothetical protein